MGSEKLEYFLKLFPNTTDLYTQTDYFIEVWQGDSKVASFGGAYSDTTEKLCTVIATNLNTIEIPRISSIEKDSNLQEVDIPLEKIQELMETGIKHTIVDLSESKGTFN